MPSNKRLKEKPGPKSAQCHAAQSRRSNETELLTQLSETLPLPKNVRSNLDKASVLRMSIQYLTIKKLFNTGNVAGAGNGISHHPQHILSNTNGFSSHPQHIPPSNGTHSNGFKEGELMLKALHGFVMFVGTKGQVHFVSEEISKYTGLKQEDVIGKSLYSFLHEEDFKELYKQLRGRPRCNRDICTLPTLTPVKTATFCVQDPTKEDDEHDYEVNPDRFARERLFYVRMRCHIQKNGVKSRQTGFMLMQCSGRVKLEKNRIVGMVLIVRPMQSTPIVEIRLDGNMFSSRHNLDLKYTYCDKRILSLIGYDPEELIGKTAYHFHNPSDAAKCFDCHENLINKGTAVSKYYRFLGKTGCWIWMQTRATIITDAANKPMYVACMNYIIGEEEGRRYQMVELGESDVKKDESGGGFIDLTAINSPTSSHVSSDPGYGSGSDDHLSPGMLSPVGPAPGNGNSLHSINTDDIDKLIGSAGLFDDPFNTNDIGNSRILSEAASTAGVFPVATNSASTFSNHVMTDKNFSGFTTNSNIIPTRQSFINNFEDNDIDMVEENLQKTTQSNSNVIAEKNITITLPGSSHQGQDINATIGNVLLQALQLHGGQRNIQISIETSKSGGSKSSSSSTQSNHHIQKLNNHHNNSQQQQQQQQKCVNNINTFSGTSPGKNGFFSVPGTNSSCVDGFADGNILSTSPGLTGESLMETMDDYSENLIQQKINDAMGTLDPFTGSPLLDVSQFPDDILGFADSNPLPLVASPVDLADNLLNDVSLGTTVSYSNPTQVPSGMYTNSSTTMPVISPSKIMPQVTKSHHTTIPSRCSSSTKFPQHQSSTTTTTPQHINLQPHSHKTMYISSTNSASSNNCSSTYSSNNAQYSKINGTNTAVCHNGTRKQQYVIDSEELQAARRGLDDHSYTAKQPSHHSNNNNPGTASTSTKSRVRFQMDRNTDKKPASQVLEHLLTTSDRVNPMKGSDGVARKISQLRIEERSSKQYRNGGTSSSKGPTLLKKLLTEKNCDGGSHGSGAINRSGEFLIPNSSGIGLNCMSSLQNSAMSIPSSQSHSSSAIDIGVVSDHEDHTGLAGMSGCFGEPGVTDLSLLDSGPVMDSSLWGSDVANKQPDCLDELNFSSEMDEILQQENWLEEEWTNYFIEKLS